MSLRKKVKAEVSQGEGRGLGFPGQEEELQRRHS